MTLIEQSMTVRDSPRLGALTAERLEAERVMATGTVEWFSVEDGYGSICPDEGDDDLFVQAEASTDIGALTKGARVRFEVRAGPHGLEAWNVVPIDAR